MSSFVVDSNFFIQAHRVNYPLDVVESFWSKIEQLATAGKIISIDKVQNEIYQNDDELKYWCQIHLPDSFFRDTSSILQAYGEIINWAVSRKDRPYLQKAIDEFLDADEADAWLIAYALAEKIPIVTHEVSTPNGKAKIKIPDVCHQFNISYKNTIGMFRELGEKF